MSRSVHTAFAAVLMLALGACRDMPAPPTEPERTEAPQAFPLQLTFSVQDDRAPSWSPNGDSVYYTAQVGTLFDRPATELRAIARTAGVALPLYPAMPPAGASLWLADAVPAPAGARIALTEVPGFFSAEVEAGSPWSCSGDPAAIATARFGPRLTQVRIRVLPASAVNPLDAPTTVTQPVAGRAFGENPNYTIHYHPFQVIWDTERVLPFHPSWSPDGQRIAFSDGLRVLIWQPSGGAAVQPLPGSQDGVAPAWSPDGSRIAYTRIERADSAKARCVGTGLTPPVQERTVYTIGDRRLVVSAVDGSSVTDLGIGEDPEWSRDGQHIYAVRNDAIWRIAADGSSATEIAETDGAREPVISPNGQHLAFARRSDRGDYDIWVVAIP